MVERLTAERVPVPVRVTVCVPGLALSVNERLPEAEPAEVGLNVIATVQDPPDGATGLEVEQVVPDVAIAKGPEALIAVKVRLALPVLLKVTESEALVVLTDWLPKVRLLVERLTTGALPVPVPVSARV